MTKAMSLYHTLPALLFAHNHNHGDDVGGWRAKIWTITMATTMTITIPLHHASPICRQTRWRWWWLECKDIDDTLLITSPSLISFSLLVFAIGRFASHWLEALGKYTPPPVVESRESSFCIFEEVGDWVASRKMVDNHEVQKSLGLWAGKA